MLVFLLEGSQNSAATIKMKNLKSCSATKGLLQCFFTQRNSIEQCVSSVCFVNNDLLTGFSRLYEVETTCNRAEWKVIILNMKTEIMQHL